MEGTGRHNIAGLQQPREGVVVHQHGTAQAAAEAAQVLHIVLPMRPHCLRPACSMPSHAILSAAISRPPNNQRNQSAAAKCLAPKHENRIARLHF